MNPEEMYGRLSGHLSLRSRIGAVAALVLGLGGAVFLGALWATEPSLRAHTHVAFGMLEITCLAWAGFGTWRIARRTPLYALDGVIAGGLALASNILLMSGVIVLAITRPGWVTVAAAAFAALMVATSAVLLARARARRAVLLRRRHELENGE
ncbi:hypothetical protein [Sinosporangium siamense]|uniref:Uncharacterized protein n=1 Tax=Sinosporangium siamense TaxID=1367973 RepID=A0A919VC38_9ACTN|nr:hypothetical protein [Sinosporangium siamense]GII92749.1 hypothetical protein Ssi02_29800 [Sinosporangium siamense]